MVSTIPIASLDDELRLFFEKCAEKANEYWFNEGGGSDMYIRVSEIVANTPLADLVRFVYGEQV